MKESQERETEPAGADTEQLRADGNWWCWCSKRPPALTTTEYFVLSQLVVHSGTLQGLRLSWTQPHPSLENFFPF